MKVHRASQQSKCQDRNAVDAVGVSAWMRDTMGRPVSLLTMQPNTNFTEFCQPMALLKECEDARMTADWNPVETMPYSTTVMVRTVTGIECLARRAAYWPVQPAKGIFPTRVRCYRYPQTGDLSAVGWRANEEASNEQD